MLHGELPQNVRPPADHGRRRALREQRGEELLVAVAQALRAVHHQHPGALGLFQQVGGIDVLVVERRVLAHQDHVQLGERQVDFLSQFVPASGVREHLQRAHAAAGLAGLLVEVLLLHVVQRPAAGLGGQQHRQRAVLLEVDACDGVHDDPEAYAHERSSRWAERRGRRRRAEENGMLRVAPDVHPVKEKSACFGLYGMCWGECAKRFRRPGCSPRWQGVSALT
ncbi:hypothetical protein D3C76_1096110 [compost metagenome]